MKLTAESGLWSTGSLTAPPPLVAVLEVSGAVLAWPVGDPGTGDPVITFTDHRRADWLWRVVGEAGHVAVVEALAQRDSKQPVEMAGVATLPVPVAALRRLAMGHWLRRWWPASERDGILALDRAVLDAEIALLTVGAEDYFSDDTIDSDVHGLLLPHVATLNTLAAEGDPRITELVERCRELADEIGLAWTESARAPRRADYALAAGAADASVADAVIGRGVATVNWSAVPPGVFDAAEDTVGWTVVPAGSAVNAHVQVALAGPGQPDGIAVNLRCGEYHGAAVLDAAGRAVFQVLDAGGQPLDETPAWNQDWSAAVVSVGVSGAGESEHTRTRVRELARARLATPGEDAYLAEVLAAESDY
ncbi:hypothetical protein M1247_32660 [Mycobacterium sp. 21AC1]|uniref:hypothetical protein n=1 Tax=[Mycobacterium] appelbergii TaxID=2939269 RepID=UPI002938D68F|nr:hypothetical protein [Mycobacterium sp. 21AC1]MDV3129696.1 hypothetical protein [Mycobacterium sp. 21AC1]